jgi:hypothetical protein
LIQINRCAIRNAPGFIRGQVIMGETNALKIVSARHVSDRHTFRTSLTTKGLHPSCVRSNAVGNAVWRLDQTEQNENYVLDSQAGKSERSAFPERSI